LISPGNTKPGNELPVLCSLEANAMKKWILLMGSLVGLGCGGQGFESAPAGTAGGGGEASTGTATAGSGGSGGAGGAETVVFNLFVNPITGSDAAPGTEDEPFGTLKHALSVAAAGQTVWLQSGGYSTETGEDWSVPVPDGVSVRAVVPGDAVLLGPGPHSETHAVALAFAGSGQAMHVGIRDFPSAIYAEQGQHLLVALEMAGNHTAIRLSGAAATTCSDCVVFEGFNGFDLRGDSSLTLAGVDITNFPDPCGPYEVGFLADSAALWGTNVHFHDSSGGISVRDAATVELVDSLLHNIGRANQNGHCGTDFFSLSGSPTLHLSNTILSGVLQTAIQASDQGEVRIENSKLFASVEGRGIAGVRKLTMDQSSIFGTKDGYAAIDVGDGTVEITGSTVAGFARGIVVGDSDAKVRVRSSVVTGEEASVMLFAGTLDLGTPADPGANELGNAKEAVLDVFAKEPLVIQAYGNSWIPDKQGSNPLGLYAKGKETAGPFGCSEPKPRNLCISMAGPKVLF